MRFAFDYDGPEGAPFSLPDARVLGGLRPREGSRRDVDVLVWGALADPVGASPLRARARTARRVLLLVDDATRGTPVARLLPHVAGELAAAGVDDDAVTVLTAQGTHRRMTDAELDSKLGPGFVERWSVEQHDWRDTSRLFLFGHTRAGLPVLVNEALGRHDLVIGIGQVGVHGIMGYSGGAKIVVPGVSGHDAEAWTHWSAVGMPMERLMGFPENPIRRSVEEAARMAGLDAVINVVMDTRGRVEAVAFGDPVAAHRRLASAARDLYEVDVPGPADVVVTDARPADRDVWQSVKGLYAAGLVVRDGGSIVLASPNHEGVAANHPNVLQLAGLPFESIRERVERGLEADVVGAAVAALIARLRTRARVHVVSSGVAPAEARQLGFEPHSSLQEAVDAALAEQGARARAVVLEGAGGMLPVVPGRNEEVRGATPSRLGGTR